MILKAVVIDQLEHDGHLRTFKMFAEPGQDITVAFADEYEDLRSGPFHFLDEHRETEFAKAFGECKVWKLPKSRFSMVNDEGVFKHSWANIPTERSSLSYYALSLPELAVPTRVEFKDPHSDRLYSNRTIRDDQRNRIVLYLECRSSRGSFDFSLHVTFRHDRSDFRNFQSSDEHNKLHDARIPSYDHLLMPDQSLAVVQFFSQDVGAMQMSPDLPSVPFEVIPSVQPKITPQRAASKEAKSNAPDKLLARKRDLSEIFDGANLTDIQREVASLKWEYEFPVAAIARRLGKHKSTIEESLSAAEKRMAHAHGFEKRAAKRSTDSE
jgi:hypothetical protein